MVFAAKPILTGASLYRIGNLGSGQRRTWIIERLESALSLGVEGDPPLKHL